MKSFVLPHFTSLVLAIALAYVPSRLSAATTPGSDDPLVIVGGVIKGVTSDGKPVRATLRTLADELMRRYPPATINIVGVDDVVIDQITLRWPKQGPDQAGPAVSAILNTLAEVTEHRKFGVTRFGENEFLLSARAEGVRANRSVEVFNLRFYLFGSGDKNRLESELKLAGAHLANLERKSKLGTNDPSALQSQIDDTRHQYEILERSLSRFDLSKDDISKRIDQIIQVVNSTLQQIRPGERAPDFEFHAGTNLLIVMGSEAAIDVTRKVVAALEKSSN